MNFSRIPRDVSRALYILIRSRLYSRAAGTRMRQHPVPSRAAWTYLRAGVLTCSRRIGAVTCGWLIKLRLAYILCYFIRNLRLVLIICIDFTNAEYLIAPVDFIVALRRTRGQRRWTLRESLSSILWTLTPHPGVIRCGGALWLPRFIPIQIACIRCYRLSPVPNIVQLSVFGSVSRAFQSGCWVVVVRFSLLGGGAVRSCGYVGFCYGLSLDLR